MKRYIAFLSVALMCITFIVAPRWYAQATDTEMEGAACIPSANCANCLNGLWADPLCSSTRRCIVFQCTGGNTPSFKFCVRSSLGGQCTRTGSINVTCTGCTMWKGVCMTTAGCGLISSPDCGASGGEGPQDIQLAQTCQ